ncbi:hypothetical protein Bpfe_010734, partial [Biomphalaria pfeifferi]
ELQIQTVTNKLFQSHSEGPSLTLLMSQQKSVFTSGFPSSNNTGEKICGSLHTVGQRWSLTMTFQEMLDCVFFCCAWDDLMLAEVKRVPLPIDDRSTVVNIISTLGRMEWLDRCWTTNLSVLACQVLIESSANNEKDTFG